MPLHTIAQLDDPRLAPYRELKDRTLAARHGLFVAEGEHLLYRLLASDFRVASVLIADRRAAEIAPLVPAAIDVFSLPQEWMNQIVGFRFHSGVVAMGVRKPLPTLVEVLATSPAAMRLVVCPDVTNAENFGSLIRLSAGFGADAMIVGPRSIDPFIRQSVRVSMGTIFRLPIVESKDLVADLAMLRSQWGVHRVASVLSDQATPLVNAKLHDRLALMFGNEAQGLDAEAVAISDERVTIPMRLGTDSLNVAVAAGIFMYHYWG